MSFQFTVSNGPAADFATRAAAAKADLEKSSGENDYALTQLASDTADLAVKTASELVAALAGSDEATAYGSVSGHHPTGPGEAVSVNVSVSVTPAAQAETPSASTTGATP